MSLEPRTNLNLLPRRYRQAVLVRAALTLWACIWVAGGSGVGLLVWRADQKTRNVQDELAKYERMHMPVQIMAQEVELMRRRLVDVEAEQVAASSLEDRHPALTLLGIVGRAARACDQRLQVRKFSFQKSLIENEPIGGSGQILVLEGAALDLMCVTKFHGILRDCGMFARVDPKPTVSEPIGSDTGYSFEIQCMY